MQNLFKFHDSPAAKTTEQDKLDWLRLARTDYVGPVTFYNLIEAYGSAKAALQVLPELSRRGGRKNPLTPPALSIIEKEYAALKKLGGELITANEDSYPLALAATDDAPPVLSVLGNPALLNKPCIGIVGARNASLSGRKIAAQIANDLGRSDHIVVSGLARGIDTAAHEGALRTGTIAVLAGGVDNIYPEENRKLYEQIKDQGAILAESPLGHKPLARCFPRRNRIVSGLSSGVIVVEATFRSGSLITARLAGEQGRDVFAVPGSPLDPRAQGPNHLIREGATLVRSAEDILEALKNFSGKTLKEPSPAHSYAPFTALSDDVPENAADKILSNLSQTPVILDELIRTSGLSVPALQTTLLELELAGRIQRSPGNRISLLQ